MKRQELLKEFDGFVEELKGLFGDDIHSIHLVGSILNEDFLENSSDVNSIVVFKNLRFSFVKALAGLGKKYRKKKISAPWLMDPDYISRSLDSFPLEFLNFKLLHRTVYGEDIFAGLSVEPKYLRLQIERELKSKLIWLRQGYLSSMGEPKALTEYLKTMAKGLIPLLRGISYLHQPQVPTTSAEVLFEEIKDTIKREIEPVRKVWQIRQKQYTPSKADIDHLYEDLYGWLTELSKEIDETVV
jgi:predicted nucleotidyltransferase